MDKSGWLILPREVVSTKPEDSEARLSEMMNLLDEGKGFRFTDEQADAIKKIIKSCIRQIKASNKARNKKKLLRLHL